MITGLMVANAFGGGTAQAMLWFPITYFAMRKQYKLKPLGQAWYPFGGCVLIFTILGLFGLRQDNSPIGIVMIAMVPIFISAEILYYTHREAASSNVRPNGVSPYGVHGWLRFYIFASVFFLPLAYFGVVSNEFTRAEEMVPQLLSFEGWSQYKTASWIRLLAMVGWQWWVAYGLNYRLERRSVFHVKLLLCVVPFGAFVDLVFATLFMHVAPNQEMVGSVVGSFFFIAFVSLIWYLYFTRSIRVRNTYGLQSSSDNDGTGHTKGGTNKQRFPITETSNTPMKAPSFHESKIPAVSAGNPPLNEVQTVEDRLDELKRILDRGLITREEFEVKKADLLSSL